MERLIRIFQEEILPRVDARRVDFELWCDEGKKVAQQALQTMVSASKSSYTYSNQYLQTVLSEGLAGPASVRLILLFATADALKKLLVADGPFDLGTWTASEWLTIAFAYLRLRMDLTPRGGKS
jgi:hypothetical protein